MAEKRRHGLVLETRADYRRAIQKAATLRRQGALAETNEALADLEGAIARYAAQPGKPDVRKGRVSEDGSKSM